MNESVLSGTELSLDIFPQKKRQCNTAVKLLRSETYSMYSDYSKYNVWGAISNQVYV